MRRVREPTNTTQAASGALPRAYSYFKALYTYPQAEFPYASLRDENRRRGRREPEYELTDAGMFDGDRYWDITAEYAKASPDDIHPVLRMLREAVLGANAVKLFSRLAD